MESSVRRSLQEYGRGIAGGLLFSLPMLYTMELWWTGFLAGPLRLLALLGVTFVLLVGYNHFGGFRAGDRLPDVLEDSVVELGLGLGVAAGVLWLVGQLAGDGPLSVAVGKVVVTAASVAIGISVGRAQLGGDDSREKDRTAPGGRRRDHAPGESGHFWAQLVIGICGAVLVAANVAPTEEIVLIAVESTPLKLLGLATLSILLGGAILFHTDFRGALRHVRRPERWLDVVTGTAVMYSAALGVAGFMLWFFDRFSGVTLATGIAQTVVLGFPAALGTSAGRLLLQH